MRVLFDHQTFWLQRYGGISRYYVELIEQLRAQGVNCRIALWHSENTHLRQSQIMDGNAAETRPEGWSVAQWVKRRANLDIDGFMNQRRSINALKRDDWDIFHPTYYYPYFLEHLRDRPFVLTVHDMIHETFPDMFKPSDPTSKNKRTLIDRAEKIIAISESTKNDMIRFCGISPSKVEVVHHGPTLDPSVAAPRPDWLPSRYVLFVGNRFPYKNFERFILALSEVIREEPELHLVCGGGSPFREYEVKFLEGMGMLDRTRYTDVDDPLLACLYRHAEAFVFPSLYEGFGFPLLEAMACGCPVIASNTSSFPEVASDAAALFDPTDEVSMTETILNVIRDGEMRRRLRERGLSRSREFSWERTAQKTRKVYEGIFEIR